MASSHDTDRLFVEATGGASFLQFLRVSEALFNNSQDATTVRRGRFSNLVSEVSQNLQCDKPAARAALKFLTTSFEEVRAVIHSGNPRACINTTFRWRPLLELPDKSYMYAPASFGRRLQISYIKAALSGSWPYELAEPSTAPFASYLMSRRSKLRPRHDFERQVINEIQRSRIGNHWAANIEPNEAVQMFRVNMTWEIDALAADSERRILWVVSAKDPAQVLSARQVKNQLNDFYGGNPDRIAYKSSTATLHLQVKLFGKNIDAVVAALGAAGDDRSWEVRGVFVTRIVCPAADRRKTYPIILLSELNDYLNDPPAAAPEKSPNALVLLNAISGP